MKRLNFTDARHFVERTGIGSELDRIQVYQGRGLDEAVLGLLSNKPVEKRPKPNLMKPLAMRKAKKALRQTGQRKKANLLYKKERNILQHWGLRNLLEANNPLHERMVWFWHNHFTSSIKKVRTADWMLRQDLLIRQHALGSFSDLLKDIAFSPAMLIYLDGKSNRKGQPNENFARELLELFTLGEGHYSENDIKEAARAFTGWRVSLKKDRAVFRKKQHDTEVKQFMGRQGKFTSEDILSILLDNERTAEFICEKLWQEFVSIDPPEPTVIKSWATRFKSSGYNIASLLETIFKSPSFWDEKYKGGLIKSPIDLVVGTLRTLDMEGENLPMMRIHKLMKRMGQELYAPPNVKGWIGGKAWIDDVTLPLRQSFLRKLLRGNTGIKKTMDNKMSSQSSQSKMKQQEMPLPELPSLDITKWDEWLLPLPPVVNINKKNPQARLRAILLDPTYQLK